MTSIPELSNEPVVSVPTTDSSAQLALEKLEQIDKDIEKILQCALDTVHELENLPHVNFSKLQQLSQAYFDTCDKVKADMKHNVQHIQPYTPSGLGNYGLKKTVELAEAKKCLDDDEDLSSPLSPLDI